MFLKNIKIEKKAGGQWMTIWATGHPTAHNPTPLLRPNRKYPFLCSSSSRRTVAPGRTAAAARRGLPD